MRVMVRARGVVVVGVMAGLVAVALAVTLVALRAQRSLPAGGRDAHQSVEWAEGPGPVRWTLIALGIGVTVSGDACDRDDYVMRINRRGSNGEPPDRYRIYAFHTKVRASFQGKSAVGHRLTDTGSYLCLGFRDTWAAGGPQQVAAHLLVWIAVGAEVRRTKEQTMTNPSHAAPALAALRSAKDAAFRDDPHSPLTPDQRAQFTGLVYYPFNPDLRLELALDRDVATEPVILETSTGESQEYRRAGTVQFVVEEQPVTLTVYQDPHGGLFLPLHDATSGHETYGAGRYLEPQLLPDGRVLVDFNELYNPYCAYNDAWSCPLPPRENWLTVPMRAGEQTFKLPDGAAHPL